MNVLDFPVRRCNVLASNVSHSPSPAIPHCKFQLTLQDFNHPIDSRLAEGCGPFIAGVTTELQRRCPPDLAGTLLVVAGELDDAERYGALAAADAYAAALVSETSRRVPPPAVTSGA